MVIRVSHLTDQVEIGGGVHAPILPVERGPAPPPSAGPRSQNPNANPTPSPALDSYTSIPLGGYDDPFLFQCASALARCGKKIKNGSYGDFRYSPGYALRLKCSAQKC